MNSHLSLEGGVLVHIDCTYMLTLYVHPVAIKY